MNSQKNSDNCCLKPSESVRIRCLLKSAIASLNIAHHLHQKNLNIKHLIRRQSEETLINNDSCKPSVEYSHSFDSKSFLGFSCTPAQTSTKNAQKENQNINNMNISNIIHNTDVTFNEKINSNNNKLISRMSSNEKHTFLKNAKKINADLLNLIEILVAMDVELENDHTFYELQKYINEKIEYKIKCNKLLNEISEIIAEKNAILNDMKIEKLQFNQQSKQMKSEIKILDKIYSNLRIESNSNRMYETQLIKASELSLNTKYEKDIKQWRNSKKELLHQMSNENIIHKYQITFLQKTHEKLVATLVENKLQHEKDIEIADKMNKEMRSKCETIDKEIFYLREKVEQFQMRKSEEIKRNNLLNEKKREEEKKRKLEISEHVINALYKKLNGVKKGNVKKKGVGKKKSKAKRKKKKTKKI